MYKEIWNYVLTFDKINHHSVMKNVFTTYDIDEYPILQKRILDLAKKDHRIKDGYGLSFVNKFQMNFTNTGEHFLAPNVLFQNCFRCNLCKYRENIVHQRCNYADPTQLPEIVFIGQAPGSEEDEKGYPFVGPSGEILEMLLEKSGLKSVRYLATNVVGCRPNRDGNATDEPNIDEMIACSEKIWRTLCAIKPKITVFLGSVPAMLAWGKIKNVSDYHRNKIYKVGMNSVAYTFHPAHLLRQLKKGSQSEMNMTVEFFSTLVKTVQMVQEKPMNVRWQFLSRKEKFPFKYMEGNIDELPKKYDASKISL